MTPLLATTLLWLEKDPRFVWSRSKAAHTARLATGTPAGCDPSLLQRVAPRGLWLHQHDAIDLIGTGSNVVISTPTSSGKSLCYQVPIAAAIARAPTATALVIHPTKALGHDQLLAFAKLVPDAVCADYDGDTPWEARAAARKSANVLFTNPEMLHATICANHLRWSRVWSNLRYVVIDEAHTYRGSFGIHMGHILRRLGRIAAFHSARPQFIFTSATIDGPGELASRLLGQVVEVVGDDGSPRGETTQVLWNPRATGKASSLVPDSAHLLASMIERDHRCIVFCRSRGGAEAIAALARELSPSNAGKIESYRAGYTADERRSIERRLGDGSLTGVVSTSALEMGIDIGDLDVAISAGFPGSLTSLRQQAGRVGRRGQPAASILVAGNDQLDQWFARHPTDLIDRKGERVMVNIDNHHIARKHLACAAHEIPLDPATDDQYWPAVLDEVVCDLASVGLIEVTGGRARFAGRSNPAREVGLRTSDAGTVRIEDRQGSLIGTVDVSRAPATAHPGARYLHRGVPWKVVALDIPQRLATAERDDRGSVRTVARSVTTIDHVGERAVSDGSPTLHLGSVEVTEQVVGYSLIDARHRSRQHFDVAVDPISYTTDAVWIDFGTTDSPKLGALHAAEHALVASLPLLAICDTWDVGGHSHRAKGSRHATIHIHDTIQGGAGLAALAYYQMNSLASLARDLVAGCDCAEGCPSCVVSGRCARGNEHLDKAGANEVLGRIVTARPGLP
ncbi:MAG: DEAD/DEAH box helicase [Actinomycetia bacterium]|nr:DEAD/DEAH box helicase [Actinomycetes bacterium]MCP4961565.1 DEAD/DEAH box helicase [Actinomycetes bacterium]